MTIHPLDPNLMVWGQPGAPNAVDTTTPMPVVLTGASTTSSATILSQATNATGSTFNTFTSTACTQLDIVNTSGAPIEYRRGGAGNTIQIPNNSARAVTGITNASQVGIRRVDLSNTQVTVSAEAIS